MSDDFFVGYAGLPESDRRFLRQLVPVLLVLGLAVAAVIALESRNPGTGSWAWDAEQTWEGVLRVDPYPRLVLDDDRSALIVSSGKLGARDRIGEHADHRVTVRGVPLERDGHLMIELVDGEMAFTPGEAVGPSTSRPTGAMTMTLTGEILDSKCHLGAMKPGDGKTHKACATLCIDGGIPPVLGTWDSVGTASFWLLTTPDGEPAGELIRDVIGEPVRVSGRRSVREGAGWMAVEGVTRLGGE